MIDECRRVSLHCPPALPSVAHTAGMKYCPSHSGGNLWLRSVFSRHQTSFLGFQLQGENGWERIERRYEIVRIEDGEGKEEERKKGRMYFMHALGP